MINRRGWAPRVLGGRAAQQLVGGCECACVNVCICVCIRKCVFVDVNVHIVCVCVCVCVVVVGMCVSVCVSKCVFVLTEGVCGRADRRVYRCGGGRVWGGAWGVYVVASFT